MQINTGFSPAPNQHLQQLRDERHVLLPLLQEVRVAVLAFHNRAGILLVNSASSFKASCVSPLLPPTSVQQPWTRRREKLRTRSRRPRTHRLAKRRRRRRRARPPRAPAPARRRPRPAPRRRPAFGSAHVSQRPQCALARHETAAKLQAIRVAAPSVPGNDKPTGSVTQAWTPEELAYAARVSDLYGRGVLPNCPAPTQCRISELWDDGVVARERRRYGWITIFQRRRASRSAFYYRGS